MPARMLALLLALALVAGDAGADTQRHILNEGYSMLYADASHLDEMDLVLYVKIESDAFGKVIREVSTYGEELKESLERVAHDYPAVRIDLTPLPEMETRKRRAIAMDRVKQFAPLVGHGGREYERTMLISLSNGLNHESHLCKVMAAEEPDPGLKKFLLASQKHYEEMYRLVMNLLEREHFRSGPISTP